jgi:hypothetical protein
VLAGINNPFIALRVAGGLFPMRLMGSAETHHNPRRRMMSFALLYPSYSGNGGKRMEECGLPGDR